MRRRLLVSTLTIALVAIVTLGLPLLLLARGQVWSSAHDTLRQQAASVAAGLEDRLDAGLPVDLSSYAAIPDRRIVVERDGRQVASGPRLTGALLASSVHVSGSTVTVETERAPVLVRARQVSLLVVALMALAVCAAVALALAQTRRLTAPLSDLLERVDALGRGEFAAAAEPSGIREIDGVFRGMERSAEQIAAMIEQQRDFASDAAHQLRTPLTGIGLHLDELSRIGNTAVRAEAEDALAQVERLDRVISALLARARGDAEDPARFDLSRLVGHETPTWARALAARGRRLSVQVPPRLFVRARRDHVAGALSCLLDNALQHGEGQVTVTATDGVDQVVLEVSDQGPGVPVELATRVFDRRVSGRRGTGIGLALARSLAASDGGRLDLKVSGSGGGARFQLILPSGHPS